MALKDGPLFNVPAFLREHLNRHDMNQSEFAMRMGTSKKHISEVMNGLSGVSWHFAFGCGYVLGVKPIDLMKIQDEELLYRARKRAAEKPQVPWWKRAHVGES